MTNVDLRDILRYIERLTRFPAPTICRHAVAADLLSLMIGRGWHCPEELARAVVEADDEAAIRELREAMGL